MKWSMLLVSVAAITGSGLTATAVMASVPPSSEPSSSDPVTSASAEALPAWSVAIGGDVDSPVSLTAADLAALPQQS